MPERCPDCKTALFVPVEVHRELGCPGEADHVFTGECAMCGQGYDDYMRHLKDCPAAGGKTVEDDCPPIAACYTNRNDRLLFTR